MEDEQSCKSRPRIDVETNEPHDCPYGRIVNSNSNRSNKDGHNNRNEHKDDIFNVTKAVVRKSILMQTARARVVNSSH